MATARQWPHIIYVAQQPDSALDVEAVRRVAQQVCVSEENVLQRFCGDTTDAGVGKLAALKLINLIVDQLDADVSSLQSCALTARTFVSPSQSHLFRKIEIRPESVNSDNDSSPSQQLYHTLTASPRLASLVRELRIVLVGSETPWEWDERHGDYGVERPAPWVMSDPALPLLLPLLHLTAISLVEDVVNSEWNGEGAFCMHWGRLAPPLKSALTTVFSSYTLESVHLRGLVVQSPRELLSLFSDTVSLKSLSISRIFFDPAWAERNSWPEEQPWKPRLRTLLICDFYSQEEIISRFLNPRIDLSHLTSLTIAAKEHAWQDNLDKMVKANVFRCLEHLTVLKDKTVPVDSRLETITFDSVPAPFPHDATPLNRAVELALDRLRFLRRVDINTLPFRETDFAGWAASIRSALPSLESRDLLSMTDLSGLESTPLLQLVLNPNSSALTLGERPFASTWKAAEMKRSGSLASERIGWLIYDSDYHLGGTTK
ncbi:hypothetical protein FB45DRAFT_866664 [Roridomyces roridus]|uniref:Uncharacterized protein n=1 Tax=Roridomyces roridus TaxID=1738132 RepID=A0AAD7FQK5_9AGAR|nr:hypothetical protein FB45DRAFT_866664 [Roridomyces roridus]